MATTELAVVAIFGNTFASEAAAAELIRLSWDENDAARVACRQAFVPSLTGASDPVNQESSDNRKRHIAFRQ